MLQLLLIAAIAAGSPPVDVETLGSGAVSGRLVALDAEQVTLQTAKGPVSVEIDQIVALSPVDAQLATPSDSAARVELIDGGLLLGTAYSTSGPTARLLTLPASPTTRTNAAPASVSHQTLDVPHSASRKDAKTQRRHLFPGLRLAFIRAHSSSLLTRRVMPCLMYGAPKLMRRPSRMSASFR